MMKARLDTVLCSHRREEVEGPVCPPNPPPHVGGYAAWALIAVFLISAVALHAADFTSWPAGASPQEIGRRVAEKFAASPHGNFGRTNPPTHITYPETCAWYGALTFAKAVGDP